MNREIQISQEELSDYSVLSSSPTTSLSHRVEALDPQHFTEDKDVFKATQILKGKIIQQCISVDLLA